MKGIPDVARHAPVTVTECTDTDNFPYPQVFTIMQKVGTKSIDKPWQNCARKLSEKQILLFRGSSVLRRLGEIHARWKVCKKDKSRWTLLFSQLISCNLPDFTSKAKWKYWIIESCQGDSGGPLIATSTRHSNSTQKRLISLKSIYGAVFWFLSDPGPIIVYSCQWLTH